jgi:hypothetical protein
MLNADLKAVVTRKAPARAKGDLKKATISHLRRLQKSPKRVCVTSSMAPSGMPHESSSFVSDQ